MNQDFIEALREIVDQKGISEEMLFETIEDALVAAYKKNYATLSNASQNVLVNLNSLYEGTKKLEGNLLGFSDMQIEIQYDGNNISIQKENISIVSLKPVL